MPILNSTRTSVVQRVCRCSRAVTVTILSTVAVCWAAQPASVSNYRDPAELVRKAVANEVRTANDPSARFLFHGIKTTSKGSTSRIYIETKDATAGLVVAYNGKPLTPQQRRDEEARVDRFVNNPDELQKKREQERENTERTLRITRALPDAFLYEYAGEEPGSPGIGRAGETLVRLKFRPNPHYEPPTHVEEVLTGMEGYLLIDTSSYRLACIDGTLFREVGFGWGILGHLDRGGRFVVHQQEVGNNDWEISGMTLHFTGKIMFFKTLNIDSTEIFSGFRPVPSDLSFAQALDVLKKEKLSEADGISTASRLTKE